MLLLVLACAQIPKAPKDPQVQGRSLLEASVQAHGGYQAFMELGDLSTHVVDVWHSKSATPEQPGDPLFVYNAALQKGLATFAESDARWGHDSVRAWVVQGGVEVEPDRPLFVPTYGYFLSLPFKFLDDGVNSESLGQTEFHGQTVDQVLVYFDDGVGSASDRYLVYLDAQTHRMAGMRFTFLDIGALPQLEATMEFQELEGVWLPLELDVTLIRPITTPMHTLRYEELKRLPDFDRSLYEVPAP